MLHARSVTPQRVVDRKKGELSQNSGMRRSCQKLHDKENQISYINAALNANKKVPVEIQAFNAKVAVPKKKLLKPKKLRSKSAVRGSKATHEHSEDDFAVRTTHGGFEYETPSVNYNTSTQESKIFSKIGGLQKSIECQEKTLQSLKKQIEIEKAELSEITEKFNRKTENSASKPRISEFESNSHIGSRLSVNKEPGEQENHQKSRITSLKALKQIVGNEDKYKSWHWMGQTFQKAKADEPSIAQGPHEHQELLTKVNDYRRLYEMTKQKNELAVKELRDEIRALSKENCELRDQHASPDDESLRKMERMYKNKIAALEAQLRGETPSENDYKKQISEISQKLMKYEAEIQRSARLEEQIKLLTRQLKEKEVELQEVNRTQTEKLKTMIDKQAAQKKEWSKVYSELLAEIKNLKAEMNFLSDSKRPSSYDTSQRLKTTEHSSNRLAY